MRSAYADFNSSLDRIKNIANKINSEAGLALSDPLVRELHETQQCGSVVLLSGYFEAFIKDLVKNFIAQVSGIGKPFTDLPDKFKNIHFEGGGKVLSKSSEAIRKGRSTPFGNATPEDIVSRLYSVTQHHGAYQILWEAFADTQANPNPEVVKNLATNLGLNNFWSSISSKSPDPQQWSDTALTTKLQDLISKRNACAHTGRVSPTPTAGDILDYIEALEVIGLSFVIVLEEKLQTY